MLRWKTESRMKPDVTKEQPAADYSHEKELVERLREGDEEAIEQVVQEHGPKLLAVARRITKNEEDAQDVLQESFLMARRGIAKFDGRSKLGTWLYRIVVNAALMRLRKRSRIRERSVGDMQPDGISSPARPGDTTPKPEAAAEQKELRDLVLNKIAELSEDFKNVVLLRDIEGLNTQETADALGITPGNVKIRLHRARQALRELLDPYVQVGQRDRSGEPDDEADDEPAKGNSDDE